MPRALAVSRDDLFALPLDEFVLEAIKQNELPPEDGVWRSPLWEFTRWTKARREFARSDGYAVAKLVECVLARHAPDGVDPWEHRFGSLDSIDDPRAELDTWGTVRTPANMDALTVAWQEAQRLPLRPTRSIRPHTASWCLSRVIYSAEDPIKLSRFRWRELQSYWSATGNL